MPAEHEARCTGKPELSRLHKWGPRRELGSRKEQDYTMVAYEQTCAGCGRVRSGEYSPDLLQGIFSISAPKKRKKA